MIICNNCGYSGNDNNETKCQCGHNLDLLKKDEKGKEDCETYTMSITKKEFLELLFYGVFWIGCIFLRMSNIWNFEGISNRVLIFIAISLTFLFFFMTFRFLIIGLKVYRRSIVI